MPGIAWRHRGVHPAGTGSTGDVGLLQNHGDLHLAAPHLNSLQSAELEDAVQLLPLVHGGEQRLGWLRAALFQDSHIIHLLRQEKQKNRANVRKLEREPGCGHAIAHGTLRCSAKQCP